MAFVPRPAVSDTVQKSLLSHSVPLRSLEEACRGCAHLEGDDQDDYPKGFDVDMDSEMLGSMATFHRQVLISSGKSDWQREVTDSGFPALVKAAYEEKDPPPVDQKGKGHPAEGADGSLFKGVYPSSISASSSSSSASNGSAPRPTRLSILSSSFLSSSDEDEVQSVILLPDFKVIHQVKETKETAAELVEGYLKPSVGRVGAPLSNSTLRSWPLPYSAVVLLCSHKRRDKRCHIAAPLLLNQFHHHLEHHGMEVDERGDDLSDGAPIEEWEGDREARLEETLKSPNVKSGGRVAVFYTSHIGGHRYAGNVIIYLPNGACLYYGRVTPSDVGAIVETTIMQGKVIPELLRGGRGITEKSGPEGILGW